MKIDEDEGSCTHVVLSMSFMDGGRNAGWMRMGMDSARISFIRILVTIDGCIHTIPYHTPPLPHHSPKSVINNHKPQYLRHVKWWWVCCFQQSM